MKRKSKKKKSKLTNEESVVLEINKPDCEAFSLCLALGTLEAMRSGVWPMEAGIWTLGRPVFWRPLKAMGIPKSVLRVFRAADEIDAMELLGGRDAAEKWISEFIDILKTRLAELPDRSWYARWQI